MILSPLWFPNTSWKYASLSVKSLAQYVLPGPCAIKIQPTNQPTVREKPRNSVIQISEKCRKRPLSKNEDIKAVRHFEENN